MPATNQAGSALRHVAHEPAGAGLLERLGRARGHPARSALRRQIRALGSAATPALLSALSDARDLQRWEAVNLLGEIARPEALDPMLDFALTEEEWHARWRSFWALGRFPDETVVPRLLHLLDQGDEEARWRAALLLSMRRRGEGADVLMEAARGDDDRRRWEAVRALRAIGLPGTEEVLGTLLHPRRSRAVRQEAVLALGGVGTAEARALLEDALTTDAEPGVRWRASMALARAGPAARPVLEAARDREEDPKVLEQLRDDIRRLGGGS